jgi:hypothetical protein
MSQSKLVRFMGRTDKFMLNSEQKLPTIWKNLCSMHSSSRIFRVLCVCVCVCVHGCVAMWSYCLEVVLSASYTIFQGLFTVSNTIKVNINCAF